MLNDGRIIDIKAAGESKSAGLWRFEALEAEEVTQAQLGDVRRYNVATLRLNSGKEEGSFIKQHNLCLQSRWFSTNTLYMCVLSRCLTLESKKAFTCP